MPKYLRIYKSNYAVSDFMVCILVSVSPSVLLFPIPKHMHFSAKASRYFGWLTAKTTGLRQEAILAPKAGNCETKGVTMDRSPKQPIIEMTA